MILLTLLACGVADREACRAATTQTVQAWDEVAGYYERMAAVEEPRMREAKAELKAAGELRASSERRRASTQYKRTTGLIDMRDGSELVDADAAAALAPRQARARRDRERGADEEADAVLALLEVSERYDALLAGALLAASVRADFQVSLTQGLSRLGEAGSLEQTELTPLAVKASLKAQRLCEQ